MVQRDEHQRQGIYQPFGTFRRLGGDGHFSKAGDVVKRVPTGVLPRAAHPNVCHASDPRCLLVGEEKSRNHGEGKCVQEKNAHQQGTKAGNTEEEKGKGNRGNCHDATGPGVLLLVVVATEENPGPHQRHPRGIRP